MANLKARELEGVLKHYGVEEGIVRICTHLLERINDNEKALTDLGNLLNRQTDLIQNFATIAGNMKDFIEAARPKE